MSSQPSAAELQNRMAQVRADLQRSTQGLRHNAQTLVDWRYHVRQHPWLALGTAGVVAFLAVPRRPKPVSLDPETVARLAEQQRLVVQPKEAAAGGSSLLASLATTAGNAMLRTGLAYLGQQVGQMVSAAVAARAARPERRQRSNGAPLEDGRSH